MSNIVWFPSGGSGRTGSEVLTVREHVRDYDPAPVAARFVSIDRLESHMDETVAGQYTLTGIKTQTGRNGRRFKVLSLVDATGSAQAHVWESSGLLEGLPARVPAPIHAQLRPRRLDNRTLIGVQAIRRLEVHEVANAARLLPRAECPPDAQPALGGLVAFVDQLRPEVLRQFLNRVLLDPSVASGLLTCKGSQGHHHHEPGGLLRHSVEVMDIVGDMAASRLDPIERSIAQVAGLLHDVGKLRSVGTDTVRPIHCLLVTHEIQTLRMLDRHIVWLRTRSREIAAGLDYTLSYLAQSPSERGYAKFVAADLVTSADRISAALANRRRLDDLLAKTLPGGCRHASGSTPAQPAVDEWPTDTRQRSAVYEVR